jgi:putative ABC transport system permease protein
VALFFTLILIALIFPYISNLVLIPQEYIVWNKSIFWIRLLIIFSIGIVVSGIYPILLVSSFSPAIVLKGKSVYLKSNKWD